jgi:serine/threonine protein kinase
MSFTQALDHPGIVRVFERIESREYLSLVLEYVSGGDLFDLIAERRAEMRICDCRRLFREIVEGNHHIPVPPRVLSLHLSSSFFS